eukprot:712103-Pleurochrysis_carterae.AAC.1
MLRLFPAYIRCTVPTFDVSCFYLRRISCLPSTYSLPTFIAFSAYLRGNFPTFGRACGTARDTERGT